MKTSSGKPYNKPSGKPTFCFVSTSGVTIQAFESMSQVEIFQAANGHEQRMVMKPSDFDNFYNRLLSNGFTLQ